MNLHPKVRAALLAAVGVVAASVAAYANGNVDAAQAISTCVAGLIPVLVGYLKSAPPIGATPTDTALDAATDA